MKSSTIYILLLTLIFTVSISAQSYDRNILLEVFTNSHCPLCPGTHSTIDSYLSTGAKKDNVRYIYYHMAFPYSDDKLNQANTSDAVARNNFYGPFSSTPISFFDGSTQSNSYGQWSSIIESRISIKTPVSLTLTGEKEIDKFSVSADVKMEINSIIGNLAIHFIVVENVNYNGRNGISNHKHVMREMITGGSGESIVNLSNQIISKTIPINDNWLADNLGVIVFVQNNQTREIYQSDYISYTDFSITDINEPNTIAKYFKLNQNYPNPFNPSTQISFTLPQRGNASLRIFNSIGQLVSEIFNHEMEAGTFTIKLDAGLFTSGIYFYQLRSSNFMETKKMTLIK
jgi:hypothetical protein